jgi:glucokinase
MKDRRPGAVCVDVGGSSFKAAVVSERGRLLRSSLRVDRVDSRGSAERILATLAGAVGRALGAASRAGVSVAGIGISICGPFDYEHGIGLMRGVGKYDALYGVDVGAALRQRLGLPGELLLCFDVDSFSFARGEICYGAGRLFDRVIVFTLGTGLGSAFAVKGQIVTEGPGVPWLGWIAGQPYREGILNDYIGASAIARRYRQLTGEKPGSGELQVREIAQRARRGDGRARRVFEEMGGELGAFLGAHHVREFGAECLVFGGQISRSFGLFSAPLRGALRELPSLKAVVPAADIERSALRGMGRHVFERLARG